MTTKHPFVLTEFGGLKKADARELLEALDHAGMTVLRDLIGVRNKESMRLLMTAATPPDKAMFERGVMYALQSIHQLLVVLPESYAIGCGQEAADADDRDARRHDGPEQEREGGDRGPE